MKGGRSAALRRREPRARRSFWDWSVPRRCAVAGQRRLLRDWRRAFSIHIGHL